MTIRKSERAVVYLSNSLKHWQPGKIVAIDKSCMNLLEGLQLQIDLMMDRSLRAYNRNQAFRDYKP